MFRVWVTKVSYVGITRIVNIVLARTRRLALRCKRRDERAPQLEVCAQHLLVVLVVVV